jgi:dolichol-phosphate mannosyltransferase
MSRKVSVICPSRNESASVEGLQDAIIRINTEIINLYNREIQIEFIIVDNASSDDSLEQMMNSFREFGNVQIVQHARNLGLQNSILTGLTLAVGDAAIVLQFDLQDPPNLIFEMINRWLDGEKYVITKIKKRNSGVLDSLSRTLGYLFLNVVSGVRVEVNSGDFWLIDREIINQVVSLKSSRPFFRTLLPRLTSPNSIIEYTRLRRQSGRSNFNFSGKFEFFLDALLSDTRRLVLNLFASSAVVMLATSTYMIIALWSSSLNILFTAGSYFASISFFVFAVVIEYLCRIYESAPVYRGDFKNDVIRIK